MAARITLQEFVKAARTVLQFAEDVQEFYGGQVRAAAAPIQTPSKRRGRRLGPRPGSLPTTILEMLEAKGHPMRRVEIAQTIADIRQVPIATVDNVVGRTLYDLKKQKRLAHDEAAQTYRPLRPSRGEAMG